MWLKVSQCAREAVANKMDELIEEVRKCKDGTKPVDGSEQSIEDTSPLLRELLMQGKRRNVGVQTEDLVFRLGNNSTQYFVLEKSFDRNEPVYSTSDCPIVPQSTVPTRVPHICRNAPPPIASVPPLAPALTPVSRMHSTLPLM